MIRKLLFASALFCAVSQQASAQCVATITGASFACYNNPATLQATTGGVAYQWYNYGFPIAGATSDTYSPGGTSDLTVVVDFGGCTDTSALFSFTQGSIFYMYFVNIDTSVCNGDTLTLSAMPAGGNPPFTYMWSGPNSYMNNTQHLVIPNAQYTDAGNYHTFITDADGCMAIDTTMMVVNDCDSVWPGDVNYDLTADNSDALDLALAYGATGTARTGASNSWTAQYSMYWSTFQYNGVDEKHADCNGDGTVDMNDTTAISLNYGQVHLKGSHTTQAKSAADPDLYFDLTGINFVAGTTVSVPVKLGTSGLPMNNILGIAADVHVTGIALTNAPTITATTSWMGTTANLMNFTKGVSADQTAWTLARIDHNNVSGNGTIGMVTFDIPAGSVGQDAILYFSNVKIIDNAGNPITNFNVIDDTAAITPVTVGTLNSIVNYAAIAPNPSEGQASLHLSIAEATDIQVMITDITGRQVNTISLNAAKGNSEIALPAASLAPGMYHLRITDATGAVNTTLKWVKK